MISRADIAAQMYDLSALIPDQDIAAFELGIYAYFTFASAGVYVFRGKPVYADESTIDEWGVSVVLRDGPRLGRRPNSTHNEGPHTD